MIRYNGEYEKTTVTGFVCKKCRRFWGDDEHMASYCCATKSTCDTCGAESDKGCSLCSKCREAAELADFMKLEEVEWDGETPISRFGDKKYAFDTSDLLCLIDGEENPLEELTQLRFYLCEPMTKPTFEIIDLVEGSDYGTDDGSEELNATYKEIAAIEKTVNDFLDKSLRQLWTSTNKRVRFSAETMADMKEYFEEAAKGASHDA